MSQFTFDANGRESEPKRFALSDNARGALVVAGSAAALVGMAYVAMATLTGPDGWATRVAGSAYAGDVSLVSGPLPPGVAD